MLRGTQGPGTRNSTPVSPDKRQQGPGQKTIVLGICLHLDFTSRLMSWENSKYISRWAHRILGGSLGAQRWREVICSPWPQVSPTTFYMKTVPTAEGCLLFCPCVNPLHPLLVTAPYLSSRSPPFSQYLVPHTLALEVDLQWVPSPWPQHRFKG
jgi:hypothetical protein